MSARAIVLIGPMGAGKTSVGRRVARALEVPFADTDKIVARDHGPIPDLFERHGEEHFRALERDAVAEACLLYTSPSPRDRQKSRMPSSA